MEKLKVGMKKTAVLIFALAFTFILLSSFAVATPSLSMNPIQLYVPQGTTSVQYLIGVDLTLEEGDPGYDALLNYIGDWDYYMSPIVALSSTACSMGVTISNQSGVVASGQYTNLGATGGFYGWPKSHTNSGGVAPTAHVDCGITVTIPVDKIGARGYISVAYSISGMVSYSGTTSQNIWIYYNPATTTTIPGTTSTTTPYVCSGTVKLNCSVPEFEHPNDQRIWGDAQCGRANAQIDCDGTINSHRVCVDNLCKLIEPIMTGYSVSKTSLSVGESFSITVKGDCPYSLPGKYLVECRVIHPDGHFIEIDAWDKDGSVTLPSVTCDQAGNYIVDYCLVSTDFFINGAWAAHDDTNTTVSCTSATTTTSTSATTTTASTTTTIAGSSSTTTSTSTSSTSTTALTTSTSTTATTSSSTTSSIPGTQSMTIYQGTNIIGIPGLTEAAFSNCGLMHYASSTKSGCLYNKDGHFVYYNSSGSSDGDCGSNFFSANSMTEGYGYYLYASTQCQITYNEPTTAIMVTLYNKTNIISVPIETSLDDIATICGDKTKIFSNYSSSSKSGCKYNKNGYFVYYDAASSSSTDGDCGSRFKSDAKLRPFVGYYVYFNGKNGDGSTACAIKYENGAILPGP